MTLVIFYLPYYSSYLIISLSYPPILIDQFFSLQNYQPYNKTEQCVISKKRIKIKNKQNKNRSSLSLASIVPLERQIDRQNYRFDIDMYRLTNRHIMIDIDIYNQIYRYRQKNSQTYKNQLDISIYLSLPQPSLSCLEGGHLTKQTFVQGRHLSKGDIWPQHQKLCVYNYCVYIQFQNREIFNYLSI